MTRKHIYLAGGCFWGTEHFFKQISGVVETEVGFANGQTENPTYEQVYTDQTGYAETVHVVYDAEVVSLEFLLRRLTLPASTNRATMRAHVTAPASILPTRQTCPSSSVSTPNSRANTLSLW